MVFLIKSIFGIKLSLAFSGISERKEGIIFNISAASPGFGLLSEIA